MEKTVDEKIVLFDAQLLELAKKHGINSKELKSIFTYGKKGIGVEYETLIDPYENNFLKEAIVLFDTYFHP